ncbi:hypothetical protein LSCM1_07706 [Leishmania martiniquensis]|uniref:Uncharacterized protein n=1 Tax=Leishmania martiniquensis TaxID=1580590 RepID=A0A836HIX7_9TRYP|nr:hypothetical protein LSCM1_07706 [Leishmania martiniquensis]
MMDRSATCIPSRVLRLPPPLLQRRGSRWVSVQPSPDRASLLLRGRRECQLRAAGLATLPSSPKSDDAPRWAAQPWSERGSVGSNAVGERGGGPCIVLPQPHRDLTSSCWLSTGLNTWEKSGGEEAAGDHFDPGAVVGLGDAASMVTIMRPSPFSRTPPAHGAASTWLQATIFLEDEEDAVFASSASVALRHQHYDPHEVTAPGRPCPSRYAPPVAPAWKAVEAILPCSYASSRVSSGLTDMYILCQRADDAYTGSGVAAVGRSARRPCSGVWLASVQRESSWRVPLAMPPGEDQDAIDSSADGAAACSSAELRHAARRTPRLFDVRRRLDPPLESASLHKPPSRRPTSTPAPAYQRASNTEAGPMGLVFAAAFRRHVGLYTAATVTPTVFFELPPWVAGGGGSATAGAGAAISPGRRCSSWSVASVVEAPSPPAAVLPQTSSIVGRSDYSYIVTLMRDQRCGRGNGTQSARPNAERCAQSSQSNANNNGNDSDKCSSHCSSSGSCWWLLYDCRKPSAPVWAAEEALEAPPALDDDVWHDAPVVTEWLASPPRSPVSRADFHRSSLCMTYVPLETTPVDGSRPLAVPSAGGVAVVLDSGARIPDGAGLDADDDSAGSVQEDSVLAPIMYELSPPRSLLSPTFGTTGVVTARPPRVRALMFAHGVLHYACEEAL